jgi:uncharacterized protein with gpF-like domain
MNTKIQKKVIGLSLIALLSDDLSSDEYTALIESLCNKLVESSPEIKAKLIENDALSYVDSEPEYNQEEVFSTLLQLVHERRMKVVNELLDSEMGDLLSKLFGNIDKAKQGYQH